MLLTHLGRGVLTVPTSLGEHKHCFGALLWCTTSLEGPGVTAGSPMEGPTATGTEGRRLGPPGPLAWLDVSSLMCVCVCVSLPYDRRCSRPPPNL